MSTEDNQVAVGKIPLDVNFKEIEKLRREDEILQLGIETFEQQIEGDYEIFYKEDNIIVTSDAHFVALFEEEMQDINE